MANHVNTPVSTPKTTIAGAQPPIPLVPDLPKSRSNPCSENKEEPEKISKSDKIMLWATCVIAVGTLVSAGAICFQWWEIHKGGADTTTIAEAAKVQASAAGQIAEASKRNAVASEGFTASAALINKSIDNAVGKLSVQANAAKITSQIGKEAFAENHPTPPNVVLTEQIALYYAERSDRTDKIENRLGGTDCPNDLRRACAVITAKNDGSVSAKYIQIAAKLSLRKSNPNKQDFNLTFDNKVDQQPNPTELSPPTVKNGVNETTFRINVDKKEYTSQILPKIYLWGVIRHSSGLSDDFVETRFCRFVLIADILLKKPYPPSKGTSETYAYDGPFEKCPTFPN